MMEFKFGDEVLLHPKPERFSLNTYQKLHPKLAGPFKIHKRLDHNAYFLDLPSYFNFSPIVNVEDLLSYEGHHANRVPLPPVPKLPSHKLPKEEIEILDDALVSTQRNSWSSGKIDLFRMPLRRNLMKCSILILIFMSSIKPATRQSQVFF